MKPLLIITLSTFLIACKQKRELLPAERLGNLSEEIWRQSNLAKLWLDRAREAYWPDHPNLKRVLKINEQTADCLKGAKLPDSFFKHLHDKTRVAPNSVFFDTMAEHYQAEINCHKDHNAKIQAMLEGEP